MLHKSRENSTSHLIVLCDLRKLLTFSPCKVYLRISIQNKAHFLYVGALLFLQCPPEMVKELLKDGVLMCIIGTLIEATEQ